MTRAPPTKLSVEKDYQFCPFHEMFMNHIKDMGWITSIIFTEPGTDYNIANDFRQVRTDTIERDYQALEIFTQPTDKIKKIKFLGLYSWLFNSSDELAQYFLAKESDNHHRSGPLA